MAVSVVVMTAEAVVATAVIAVAVDMVALIAVVIVADAAIAAAANARVMVSARPALVKGFRRISGLRGARMVHQTLTNEIRIMTNMS